MTVPGLEPDTHYIYASVWQDETLNDLALTPRSSTTDCSIWRTPARFRRRAYATSVSTRMCWPGSRHLTLSPGRRSRGARDRGAAPVPDAVSQAAHYYWCLALWGGPRPLGFATEHACKLFTAQHAGVVGARGEFVVGDATEPYRFALVVQPGEDQAPPQVPKPVYDDLMNFLGVPSSCRRGRTRRGPAAEGAELMESPLLRNADTERTYPRYRQRRAVGDQAMGAGSRTRRGDMWLPHVGGR